MLRQKGKQIVERQMQFEFEQAVSASKLKDLSAASASRVPPPVIGDIHLFRHDYTSVIMLAGLNSLMQLVCVSQSLKLKQKAKTTTLFIESI